MEEAPPKNPIEPLQVQKIKKNKNFWIAGSVVFVLIILGLVSVFFSPATKGTIADRLVSPTQPSVTPATRPTPFAFQEITIPYLRARTYQSNLSELSEVSSNGSYTSYLTSYTSDGFKINGLLTVPKGAMPPGGWPAIVFVHGYIPPQNYQTLVNYSSYVDHLAKNGFVVFKIDLRGHGDSEGDPGGSYYSSDYIIDVLNAHAALSRSDFVNPELIGIWGHSMAGNVAFRSLAAKPDIPAVVIWAGAVYSYEDWEKYGIQDGSYRPPPDDAKRQRKRRELFAKYGEFNPNSEFWKQVAATNYLSDIRGAIQLNHAVDDAVVNVGYSRDLAVLLDATTIEHELNEYPSGGHNISGSSFNSAMQNTVEFFKKHLSTPEI